MELRILSESPAPAARDATMAAEITEHPMRFLSWKTACAAALSAPLLALAQQPSDYAREKRWAGEVVPSIVVGEAVWLEAPRTEKFLGIYTEAKNAKGAIVLAHGLGVHPDYGLIGELRARLADAGYTTLSIQMPVLAADAPVAQHGLAHGEPLHFLASPGSARGLDLALDLERRVRAFEAGEISGVRRVRRKRLRRRAPGRAETRGAAQACSRPTTFSRSAKKSSWR